MDFIERFLRSLQHTHSEFTHQTYRRVLANAEAWGLAHHTSLNQFTAGELTAWCHSYAESHCAQATQRAKHIVICYLHFLITIGARTTPLELPAKRGIAHHPSAQPPGAFLAICDEFLNTIHAQGRSPTTIRRYRYLLIQFGEYLTRLRRDWRDCDTRLLQAFLTTYAASREVFRPAIHQHEQRRNRSTVALMATCLRSFCAYATKQGYWAISPAQNLNPYTRERPLPRAINESSIQRLLHALQNPPADLTPWEQIEWPRNRMIILLMLHTGIRLSECAQLRVRDFDAEQGTLRLTRKGGKQGIVPLHPAMHAELQIWCQALRPNDPLFRSRRGDRLDAEGISEMFRRFVQKRLKIAITAHQLRHTCATWLLNHGGTLEQIQQLLGHESVQTTQRYAQLNAKAVRDLVNLLPPHWAGSPPAPEATSEQKEPSPPVAPPPNLNWTSLNMLQPPPSGD